MSAAASEAEEAARKAAKARAARKATQVDKDPTRPRVCGFLTYLIPAADPERSR